MVKVPELLPAEITTGDPLILMAEPLLVAVTGMDHFCPAGTCAFT